MRDMRLRVASWNLNAGRGLSPQRLELVRGSLAELAPDVLLIQELTAAGAARATLAEALCSLGLAHVAGPRPERLGFGSAIASRWPLTELPAPAVAPFPELIARADVHAPPGPVTAISVHAPNGSNHGWKKIETIEAVLSEVSALAGSPFVVGGDFNEPVDVLSDGTFVSKAAEGRLPGGSLASPWTRPEKPVGGVGGTVRRGFPRSRWQSAVVDLLQPGPGAGHVRAHSGQHVTTHINRGTERFFDHIVVSRTLTVASSGYLHRVRESPNAASDHSLVWADLRPSAG